MSNPPIIQPVILSGGAGTRLWPMSRDTQPKQFLPLVGDESLIQQTVRRIDGRPGFARPLIVCGAAHMALAQRQLDAIGVSQSEIIVEPVARNTAPAIALAALWAMPDTCLLVMPSDHVIADGEAFHQAVATALPQAMNGALVTFGVVPDAPETGYGYIGMATALEKSVFEVAHFVEKPDHAQAKALVEAGNYLWNSGIFLFRCDAYLAALACHAPAILKACRAAMANAPRTGTITRPNALAFASAPALSIDYAVMEKARQVAVIPVAMGWSDLGNWDSLYAIGPQDAQGNSFVGDVIAEDTRQCLIRAGDLKITLYGVSDLIVVAQGQDVMIVPRGKAQAVKTLAARRKSKQAQKSADNPDQF